MILSDSAKHQLLLLAAALFLLTCLTPLQSFAEVKNRKPDPQRVQDTLNALRLPFIANEGQGKEQVAFYVPTFGGTISVSPGGQIIYALPKYEQQSAATVARKGRQGVRLTEDLVGARAITLSGEKRSETRVNAFLGNDPSVWRVNTPTYREISYGEVYPGVSLSLHAVGRSVEKVFTVQPGADPAQIRLQVRGGTQLRVNEQGELVVETVLGPVTFSKPVAYQEQESRRDSIEIAYRTNGSTYSFELGRYDTSRSLVIDPILASTFLGGSGSGESEAATAIALDSQGNVYIAGTTNSFPCLSGSPEKFPCPSGSSADGDFGPPTEGFVVKLDSSLQHLMAFTFLGGTAEDHISSLVLDSQDNVYVAGFTFSSDFPGINGDSADGIFAGGKEAFVAKLSSSLQQLQYATFLGGSGATPFRPGTPESAEALALGPDESVYVAGRTDSADFPEASNSAADPDFQGPYEGFVAKLDKNLRDVQEATFLGGTDIPALNVPDSAQAIVVDSTIGSVYAAGTTVSTDFPGINPDAPDHNFEGRAEAFIVQLDEDLGEIQAGTFLGGSNGARAEFYEAVTALALDANGAVFAGGYTDSPDFLKSLPPAMRPQLKGRSDGFIVKLSGNLKKIDAARFLGGGKGANITEFVSALVLDEEDNIYAVGSTFSSNKLPGEPADQFSPPIDTTAPDRDFVGPAEGFLVKFDNALQFLSATFVGGDGYDGVGALTIDEAGHVYVAGVTTSTSPSFPGIGPLSADRTSSGAEGFVTIVELTPPLDTDFILPQSGRVVLELVTAPVNTFTSITLISPLNATVDAGGNKRKANGCVTTDVPFDVREDALLNGLESQPGCRILLNADDTKEGKPFTGGTKLTFRTAGNLDYGGHVSLHPGAFPNQIFQLIWQVPGSGEKLVVVLRIEPDPCEPSTGCTTLDTDQDGLWDDWERFGIDTDGDSIPDFPLPDADPNTPDIFVEIDYLACTEEDRDCGPIHTHEPKTAARDAVVNGFAQGGCVTGHPDCVPRPIRLHIDIDEALPHSQFVPFGEPGDNNFALLKAQHFAPARFFAYHYAIFAHRRRGDDHQSGKGEIRGNDLLISLGDQHTSDEDLDGDSESDRHGTMMEQAGTFMHELGHNLGLNHGGDAENNINHKPNYPSVMNYSFQMRGINGQFTFSDGFNLPLNELDLHETVPICPDCSQAFQTYYVCNFPCPISPGVDAPLTPIFSDEPIDWDCDQIRAEPDVQANINGECPDDSDRVLRDHNDWGNLDFVFHTRGEYAEVLSSGLASEDELDLRRTLAAIPTHQDSTLRKGATHTNAGATAFLTLTTGSHIVVGIDLSQVPADFGRAKLSLTLAEAPRGWKREGSDIAVHRLTTSFVEGTGDGKKKISGSGVTWGCAVDGDLTNGRADCSRPWKGGFKSVFSEKATDTVTHDDTMPALTVLTWEVSADVRAAIAQGATEIAWLLLKQSPQDDGTAVYYSREGSRLIFNNDNAAPHLVLSFE